MGILRRSRKSASGTPGSAADEAAYQQFLADWPEAVEQVLTAFGEIMVHDRVLYGQLCQLVRAANLEEAAGLLAQNPNLVSAQSEAGLNLMLSLAQMTDRRAVPLLHHRVSLVARARSIGIEPAYQEAKAGRLPLTSLPPS
jgi:hypothetical protein